MRMLFSVVAVLLSFRATELEQPRPPVVLTTPARNVEGTFVEGAPGTHGPPVVVDGRASYTLTSANDDDSLLGTFTITLSSSARLKILAATRSKLEEIGETYSQKSVKVQFSKGTACPKILLQFPTFEMETSGGRITLTGVELAIPESNDRLVQLMCFWTRQINARRERRGIVRSINRVIEGDKAGT